MLYQGRISDPDGKPVSNAKLSVYNTSGQLVASFSGDVNDIWRVDTEMDSRLFDPGATWTFSADGYDPQTYRVNEITQVFDVGLEKSKNLLPLMLVGVGIIAFSQMAVKGKKRRKVGAVDPGTVKTAIYITGGIIGFTIVKSILEKLGLWKSKEKKELDDMTSSANNFWNPNWWQTINPNGLPYNHPLTESQAKTLIQQIKNSFGILNDDPENVKAVFKSLYTKANASFLAWEFQKTDGTDLLSYLRNGGGILPWDGLSDADVLEITTYVNSLPNF